MKKTVLAFALVLAVCLSACGRSAVSEQLPDGDHSAEMSSAAASVSQADQIRILEANRSIWEFRTFYESPWYYAYTDLDLNGRLEVIAATTQGSGIYTYANFYEVRADGSGIDNLYHADVEIEGPDDWPEIVLESLPCFYDAAEDRYYYPCEGVTHDGYAHQYYSWQALSLKDGVADWELIASKNVDWDENGRDTTECRDAQGNVISLLDYDSAVERRFAGMQEMELKLNWTQVEIPLEGDPVEASASAATGGQSAEDPLQQLPVNAAVTGTDEAAEYSSVIEQYRTAYEPGNIRNAEYAWTNGLSDMIEYSSAVGYALEDLDGNGIRELIIAGIGTDDFAEKNIFALYTLEDGTPVPVAVSYTRMRYYLQSDGSIRYVGSSGAFHTNIVRSRLNGSSMEVIDMLFTTEETNPDGSFYAACYYQQGDSERIPSEKSVKISEADFRMRLEQMEAADVMPALTLIAGNT